MKALNDAAVAALEAIWAPGRVYRIGELDGIPATPYAVVGVDSGAKRNYRAGSRATSQAHRLTVQVVGASYNEAAFAVEKADAAFLDKRITADCTPCRRGVGTSIDRDPDGGALMYGLSTYTFTA